MEQKLPKDVAPRVRIIEEPRQVRYFIGPKGLIFYLLAVLVICLGVIGYLKYDNIVKPYLEIYICCLPAAILAGILIFFGFATRISTVRKIHVQKPARMPDTPRYSKGPRTTLEPKEFDSNARASGEATESQSGPIRGTMRRDDSLNLSHDELMAQKKSLTQFLTNLEEQKNDGLIMNDVYLNLKSKYNQELAGLNTRIKLLSKRGPKKVKKREVK